MSFVRTQILSIAGMVAVSAGIAAAQAPDGLVPFGGLRVAPCPSAADPEYGLVHEKPIEMGGGPQSMAARTARYFDALRGPQGQRITVAPTRASAPLQPAAPGGEMMFIDQYTISYDGPDGPVTTVIYMNAYRFSLPRVPAGFTCGTALPPAVGLPPVNPIQTMSAMAALAAEWGERGPVALMPLDPSAPRGRIADQFALAALHARAAVAAGATPETTRLPADAQGMVVVAFPQACGDRSLLPERAEPLGPQGPLRQNGDPLRGEAIGRVLPGVDVPTGAVAVRFAGSPSQVRIVYAEACEGQPAEVLLPIRVEPPNVTPVIVTARPAGSTAEDATIYLQAIIAPDGRFAQARYLGGPEGLLPAAIEAIGERRVEPLLVNGTPTIAPIVLQVVFR